MESAEAMATDATVSGARDNAKPSIEPVSKPAAALTPPTSEEMNHDAKDEQEDSELSDLDLDDDDDLGDVKPDHYWDEANGGRIPVFKPTVQQFKSFKKYVEAIDAYGMKSGIVKVIPPKEWRDNLPALDQAIKSIRIKNPITQEFNGTFGTYTQQNVEKQRSYNLPEWKALTEESQYQPPARRGERRRNQEKVVRGGGAARSRLSVAPETDDSSSRSRRKPGRPRRNPLPTEEPASDDEPKRRGSAKPPPTPSSPVQKPAAKKARGRPPKGGQNKSVSSRRLNNTTEAVDVIDEKAFKNFNYRMDGLEEYTPERCAELETHYWKSLGFNQPMYAADMPGSLFDDTPNSWNVAKLENLLDVLGTKVPGVNTAYLYMGMWKATFAWHLEDVDLYSINYIHFGAPKQWYSISQEDARKFEKAMKTNWPVDAKNCDQFLRHKTYLISPDVLQKQYGVKVNKLVHYEGEFVITYPYGYHSGYNIGYNCAESVNFATESWLDYGRIARKCNCEADNVWVDVSEIERKLRGEPTPEYYEETDDEDDLEDDDVGNLPSPPASVKGKAPSKKRKREVKQEAPKKKKKIRIRIRAPTREPCAVCPNDNPWEPLLPTDNGKKAHLSCALYTPETFIVNENGTQKVCGVANIDKARLELKCNFCRSKRGACFQCSSKKCTRAFHATCAVAAGVLVDSGLVPTFGEDGTEYYEEGYDFRCRYHRPKMPKNPVLETMENSKRINNFAKELKPNDTVQAQYFGAEVFGGLVIENRSSEMTLIVDVLPEGERVEVEYKYVCVLDPDDSLRPKPSPTALPMPVDMHKSNFSLANRQDGVPTQDELFNNDAAYKWHDFYNLHMPPPGYKDVLFKSAQKLKVDITKPDQLYYYLPKISTDAKVFFTDKPGSKEIVAKANFLDRVSAKPTYQYPQNRQASGAAQPGAPSFMRIQPAVSAAALNNVAGARYSEKPYVYKPKDPARPNVLCAVDYQALANPRSFHADGNRRPSIYGQPQPPLQALQKPYQPQQQGMHQQQGMAYSYPHNDVSRTPTPLRSFPSDQYYSSKTLPAAYTGDYSSYRRQSHGAQTMQRPVFENTGYNSNYQQRNAPKQPAARAHTNSGTMPGNGAVLPPNPYAPGATSRPSSNSHGHHSVTNTASTPAATTMSSGPNLDGSRSDMAYIQNLQKYPYLMNSFCRRQKQYESPYPIGGGFSAKYQPLELQRQEEQKDQRPVSRHTPSNSVLNDGPRPENQQWTPPSKLWAPTRQTPPPGQHADSYRQQPSQNASQAASQRYVQVSHQTPQEFQRQIQQGMPSTASREGAQARMLRDQQGYAGYTPAPTTYQRNSFGQTYDTAKMWHSPRAPTPSPLSDPNTPGYAPSVPANTNPSHLPWGQLPKTDVTAHMVNQRPSQQQQPPGAGYGPMLPQMGGGDWKYN